MAVLSICVKWSGKEYEVELSPTDTVQTLKVRDFSGCQDQSDDHDDQDYIFKVRIMEKTGVRPERQKLLNLKVKTP